MIALVLLSCAIMVLCAGTLALVRRIERLEERGTPALVAPPPLPAALRADTLPRFVGGEEGLRLADAHTVLRMRHFGRSVPMVRA